MVDNTSIYNGTVEILHHSVAYTTGTLTATGTSTSTPIPTMTAVAGAASLVPELGGTAALVAGVLAVLQTDRSTSEVSLLPLSLSINHVKI